MTHPLITIEAGAPRNMCIDRDGYLQFVAHLNLMSLMMINRKCMPAAYGPILRGFGDNDSFCPQPSSEIPPSDWLLSEVLNAIKSATSSPTGGRLKKPAVLNFLCFSYS